MIIKHYVARAATNPRLIAGVSGEKQMAHYFNRQFREPKDYLVLHDVKVEFEGVNAKIDHLVVHPFGVAIVESKRVSTMVQLTSMDEWERNKGRSWVGMPSPLLQAVRQGRFLKALLRTRGALFRDIGLGRGTAALPTTTGIEQKRTVEEVACADCKSKRLEAKIGRFVLYLKCLDCGKHNAVRASCVACGAKVYMERVGGGFAGKCPGCGQEYVVLVAG